MCFLMQFKIPLVISIRYATIILMYYLCHLDTNRLSHMMLKRQTILSAMNVGLIFTILMSEIKH